MANPHITLRAVNREDLGAFLLNFGEFYVNSLPLLKSALARVSPFCDFPMALERGVKFCFVAKQPLATNDLLGASAIRRSLGHRISSHAVNG
jgi:hypothetical protein